MKNKILLASILAAVCLVGCKGNDDPDNPGNSYSESGLYVGITSFGESVEFYPSSTTRYASIGLVNAFQFENYIDNLGISNGTALFYAVDNNLSYLKSCKFPNDLVNVSIITFTDGLDQGSRGVARENGQTDDYTKSRSTYLAEIKDKLSATTVHSENGDIKVSAYAIGVKGGDITSDDEIQMFKENLKAMSSSENNAFFAEDMAQVNNKFKEIAESLYQSSTTITATIIIPEPGNNTKERFVFDQTKSAEESECYLEGVYNDGYLENVNYVNCSSISGNRIAAEYVGSKVQFAFENFTVADGYSYEPNKIVNFKIEEGLSKWQINSEFKPEEQKIPEVKQSSAVIMLNLDCSSSLIDEENGIDVFQDVKNAAINFINLLVSSNNSGENGDDDNDDNNDNNDNGYTDMAQVRFRKKKAYTYVTEMNIRQVPGGGTGTFVVAASYEFGTNAGTSPYYEIAAQKSYPDYYYTQEGYEGYYWALDDDNPEYYFEPNKKYTYSCGDDGENLVFTITLDGYFSAPQKPQIVAQWRVPKLHK